jgi:hypothetical protein
VAVVVIEAVMVLLLGTGAGIATESVIAAAIISGVISGIFLMVNQILTFLLERYFDRRSDQSAEGTATDETTSNNRSRRDRFIPRLSRPSGVRTVRREQRGEAEQD